MEETPHSELYQRWFAEASEDNKHLFLAHLKEKYATLKEAGDAIANGEYSYLYLAPRWR